MDRFHEALARLESKVDRVATIQARLERRQSEIIGVLVGAGLWRVDPSTGRSVEPFIELPERSCKHEPACRTLEEHEARAAVRPTCARCGSTSSHREGDTEFCSGCGAVLGPAHTAAPRDEALERERAAAGLPCDRPHPGDKRIRCRRFTGHDGVHRGPAPTSERPNNVAEWPSATFDQHGQRRWSGVDANGRGELVAHGCTHLVSGCCAGRSVCMHSVACTHGVCCHSCWQNACPENHANGHPDHASGGSGKGGGRTIPAKDPVVRKDPKRGWRGPSFEGKRFSETTSKYLEALAAFLDWCADRAAAQHERTTAGAEKAPYILDDAKLARAWALELGHQEDEARRVGSRTPGDAAVTDWAAKRDRGRP